MKREKPFLFSMEEMDTEKLDNKEGGMARIG